jgi:hypothetical protein
VKQPAGNDAPALQNQLRLRLEKHRADLEHPFRGWQADASATSPAQSGHELAVRQRVRGCQVDSAADVVSRYQKLTARMKSASWIQEIYWRPSPARPAKPRRARVSRVSKMPPRSGLIVIAERSFTFLVTGAGVSSNAFSQAVATSMLNRQVSGASGSRRQSRQTLRRSCVVSMRVNRRSACLEPHARRPPCGGNGAPDRLNRCNPGLDNLFPIRRRVPAVHGTAGEVDHHVDAVEVGGEIAAVRRVPPPDAPRCWLPVTG